MGDENAQEATDGGGPGVPQEPAIDLPEGATIDQGFVCARVRLADGEQRIVTLAHPSMRLGTPVEQLQVLAARLEQLRLDIAINVTSQVTVQRLRDATKQKEIVRAGVMPNGVLGFPVRR